MKDMSRNAVGAWFSRHPMTVFAVIGVLTVAAYPLVRGWMLDQSTTYKAVVSNATVNAALVIGLLGLAVDWVKMKRHWSERTGWMLWAGTLTAALVVFWLMGNPTRFG